MKQLIQSALSKFGLRIVRIKNAPHSSEGLDPFFSLLERFNFAPRHIVDVGANRGNWTRTALQHFPNSSYTLVEPQNHLKSNIQDLIDRGCKISWINAGAADQPGTLPMFIAQRDDSSSFVRPAPDSTGVEIPVRTLNEIVASSGSPTPEMVKIDAEGFDLRALAGASDLFGKTEIFLIEAVLFDGYENSVAKVLNAMDAARYRLLDITDMNRSPKHGLLWLMELAFVRKDSLLFTSATSYE